MKAIVYSEYGSPDVLRLENVDIPQPETGEVLVRMRAASVNAADSLLVHGQPLIMRPLIGWRRPKIGGLGLDFAGCVEAVGEGVIRLRAGDEVFGEIPQDFSGKTRAFAEYLCVAEASAVRKPEGVGFAEAAAVPLAGCTALFAIRDYGALSPGEHVLVNGAAGGVGMFVVQLAKHRGATVTAVCSGGKADAVRAAGADHVIDYRRQDFTAGDQRYDAIIDTVSSQPLSRCRHVLSPRGRYLWVGGRSTHWLLGPLRPALNVLSMKLTDRSRQWRCVAQTSTPADVETLVGLLAEGALRPVIDRRFPLEGVADAIRHLEAGRACGKVVIET